MTQILQRKLKIMLVEYYNIDNLIHSKMIEAAGIAAEVCIFTDGRSGIEYLRTIEAENPSLLPDLIFLGINLPLYDGFYFLNAFSALNDVYKSRRPVVMLTYSISPLNIHKAMSYSYVRKYINTPLTFDIIQETIEELCPPEGHSDTTCPQGQAPSQSAP